MNEDVPKEWLEIAKRIHFACRTIDDPSLPERDKYYGKMIAEVLKAKNKSPEKIMVSIVYLRIEVIGGFRITDTNTLKFFRSLGIFQQGSLNIRVATKPNENWMGIIGPEREDLWRSILGYIDHCDQVVQYIQRINDSNPAYKDKKLIFPSPKKEAES
jgi:hypothetical protein